MPELLYAGSASHSLTGRSGKTSKFDGVDERNVSTFSRIMPNINIRLIFSGPIAFHCFALGQDGSLYSWGRNENYQLGFEDDVNRYRPTLVKDIGGTVLGGSCGATHTVLFLAEGGAVACGDNDCGQCGIGKSSSNNPVIKFHSVDISDDIKLCSVSAGRGFSIAAAISGEVFAWGTPENGVLGNGSEDKTLERAGVITYAYRKSPIVVKGLSGIVKVASGAQHSLAMDKEGKVWSWGFGGYGRLGHGDAKDQFLPTPIPLFHFIPPPPNPNIPVFAQRIAPKIRAADIVCGATCNYAIGMEPYSYLFFWGITKGGSAGEATLKPTQYEGTGTWKISSVGSGAVSAVVASLKERSVASWGPGPTHGELGYGEGEKVPKSSSKPKEVESLSGARILSVVVGYGSALLLADMEDEETKKVVEKAPIFLPDEIVIPAKPASSSSSSSSGSGNNSSNKRDAATANTTSSSSSSNTTEEKPAKRNKKG
jgi:alpha-tubulin suppressor-like RCC1 family protein